jgi:hypothetical protein
VEIELNVAMADDGFVFYPARLQPGFVGFYGMENEAVLMRQNAVGFRCVWNGNHIHQPYGEGFFAPYLSVD